MNSKKYKLYKLLVMAASMAVLLSVTVGGTLAWLVTSKGPLTNTFKPVVVTCQVEERFEGGTKSDVTIKNTCKVPVYIRARIIATWKDASGNVYGGGPAPEQGEGKDYTINGPATDWTFVDPYYYYGPIVQPGNSTSALIVSCDKEKECPDPNYDLSIEIIADAIQANPATARTEAWGYPPSTGGDA